MRIGTSEAFVMYGIMYGVQDGLLVLGIAHGVGVMDKLQRTAS